MSVERSTIARNKESIDSMDTCTTHLEDRMSVARCREKKSRDSPVSHIETRVGEGEEICEDRLWLYSPRLAAEILFLLSGVKQLLRAMVPKSNRTNP